MLGNICMSCVTWDTNITPETVMERHGFGCSSAGRPVLLAVPERAVLTEISFIETAGLALFEVGMQSREAAPDFVLR